MLCETEAGPSVCTPCPVFCSFCFPILLPTPFYTCTCPPTEAPTEVPTKAPTSAAPTIAPTTASPTFAPVPLMDITASLILLAFAIGIAVLCIFCIIFIMPAGLHHYDLNDEINYYNVQRNEDTTTTQSQQSETTEGAGAGEEETTMSSNINGDYLYNESLRKRLQKVV